MRTPGTRPHLFLAVLLAPTPTTLAFDKGNLWTALRVYCKDPHSEGAHGPWPCCW